MSEQEKKTKVHRVDGQIAYAVIRSVEQIVGGDPRPTLLLAVIIARLMAKYHSAFESKSKEEMAAYIKPIMEEVDRAIEKAIVSQPEHENLLELKYQKELEKSLQATPVTEGH